MDSLATPLTLSGQREMYAHHVAVRFSEGLVDGQRTIVQRFGFGMHWPITEVFGDRTRKHLKTAHEFIQPVLDHALGSAEVRGSQNGKSEALRAFESSNLLDHLVSKMSGKLHLNDLLDVFPHVRPFRRPCGYG